MSGEEEIRPKVEGLEKSKGALIDRIRKINRTLKYKEHELIALGDYLKQHEAVDTDGPRKKKRALEFRISTSAYTPKIEKELLKELRKVEEALTAVKDVEKARRKRKYIELDIKEGKDEIVKIEVELKVIRESLKDLYEKLKSFRNSGSRYNSTVEKNEEDDLVALGDLAQIEKE